MSKLSKDVSWNIIFWKVRLAEFQQFSMGRAQGHNKKRILEGPRRLEKELAEMCYI